MLLGYVPPNLPGASFGQDVALLTSFLGTKPGGRQHGRTLHHHGLAGQVSWLKVFGKFTLNHKNPQSDT